jgi:hypothetical protein
MKIISLTDFEKDYSKNVKIFLENKISTIYYDIVLFSKKRGNQNFAILENNNLIAVIPLHFEKNNIGELEASFFNLSLPGPIFDKNLDIKKFKKILKLSLNEIDRRCLFNKIKIIKINFSDLINYDTGSQKYYSLLETLSDYNYLNKSLIGVRLNLYKTLEETISSCSKGHKFEIKKQIKSKYIFQSSEYTTIEYKDFKIILKNYTDDAKYCEILYDLYLQNKIFIVFSSDTNFFCGLFSIAGEIAEYFFAKLNSINHHSLIIESFKYFKVKKKLKYLKLGIVNYLENLYLTQSKKKKNISVFKKGFGGERYLLSIFEKKYF